MPVGEGAHGTVYRAFDTELRQPVALKVITSNTEEQARDLYREFRVASKMSHPGLAHLYSLLDAGTGALLVMEYIEGRHPTSVHWTSDTTAISKLTNGLLASVSFLHSHDLLHGDIKPENVIVDPGRGPVLVDYGLTRHIPQLREKFFAGTWKYAAPEQFNGFQSTGSDWFSVAAVIYEAIVGEDPFADSDTGRSMMRKMNGDFARELPGSAPPQIATLIYGLLSADPEERLSALKAYSNGQFYGGNHKSQDNQPTDKGALESLLQGTDRKHLHVSRLLSEAGTSRSRLLAAFGESLGQSATFIRGHADPREAIPLNLFDAVLENLGIQGLGSKQEIAMRIVSKIRSVASEVPVVLVLEEAQWADADSLDVFRRCLVSLEQVNLHIVVTARLDVWKQSASYPILNQLNTSTVVTQETILLNHSNNEISFRETLDADSEKALQLCSTSAEALSVQEIKSCDGFGDLNVVALYYLANRGVLTVQKGRDGLLYEIADERSRQATIESMSADQYRRMNRVLADMYIATGKDLGIAARYYESAGANDLAGSAAASAAPVYLNQGLASRSVDMHRLALSSALPEAERQALKASYATALQQVGLSAEAAIVLDECARLETGRERRRLLLAAAECFFVSGNIESGMDISRCLLDEIELKPDIFTNYSDMIGQLTTLHELKAAPYGSHLREGYDICWTITKNLVHLQPMLAFAYLAHCVRLALALNDDLLRAKAIAVAAGGVFSANPEFKQSQQLYLSIVEEVASDSDDAYLNAIMRMWRAYTIFQQGEWTAAARLLRASLKRLRQIPMNTLWEEMTASALYASCLIHRGMYRYLRSFSEQWVITAEANGHLYGQVTFRQMKVYYLIGIGDSRGAQTEIEWMQENWTRKKTVPHFYLSFFRAYCALVEGDLEGVDQFFSTNLEVFEKTGGYQGSTPAMHMLALEGAFEIHCRLAGYRRQSGHSMDEIKQLLSNVPRSDAPVFLELFDACSRFCSGDVTGGVSLLERAQASFVDLDMHFYAALIRYQLARIKGVEPDASYLHGLGVPDPALTARTYVPIPVN